MLQLLSIRTHPLSNRLYYPLRNVKECIFPVLIGLSIIFIGFSSAVCITVLPLTLGAFITLGCIIGLRFFGEDNSAESNGLERPVMQIEAPSQDNLRRRLPRYWNGNVLGNGRRLRFYLSSSSGIESEPDTE